MIQNRQRGVRIPLQELRRFLARAGRALRLRPQSVTVRLVSNAEIARWNRAYRGKPGATDVLSFPAARSLRDRTGRRSLRAFFASPPSPTPYLGDVAIAPDVARRNAARFGRTFSEEMRILILHGMLHLMGYDHETDNGQMERRERKLRRHLGLA